MQTLLDLFRAQILSRVEDTIKEQLAPLPIYLRQLGIGLAILISSAIAWSGMLIFLLLAVFFQLANLRYTDASLLTALLSAVIGFIMVLIGILLVRKPR